MHDGGAGAAGGRGGELSLCYEGSECLGVGDRYERGGFVDLRGWRGWTGSATFSIPSKASMRSSPLDDKVPGNLPM